MADEFDASQVVMRKGRNTGGTHKLDFGLGIDLLDGKKKVKWSDSTELREKMKEYRRSQLSICLDYQHIAVEEEREREGVKRWRETKETLEEEEEDTTDSKDIPLANDVVDEIDNKEDEGVAEVYQNSDSDDDDPYCDSVLEAKLRVIKAKASRHTLLPAYTVAVETYKTWLESDSSSDLSTDQRSKMTSQLTLYQQILDLYSQWNEADDVDKIDNSFQGVLAKLTEAKTLGEPPQTVADSIDSVLTNQENVRKHKEVYSSMVDEMVTDLSKQIQTTTL